jgi:hypothetical protein
LSGRKYRSKRTIKIEWKKIYFVRKENIHKKVVDKFWSKIDPPSLEALCNELNT